MTCFDADGVEISEVVTATTVACQRDTFDYEFKDERYCNEDTDTYWIRCTKLVTNTSSPNEPTTVEEISNTDTGVPCGQIAPTVDYEEFQYCNPDTNTLRTKRYQVVTTYDSDQQPII